MTRRVLLLALAIVVATSAARAGDFEPPRTHDGRPDLEGVWTNASLTNLERPANLESLVLTPDQAEALARGNFHNVRAAKDALPSDPDRPPPAVERLPPVGNYNAGWVEPGTTYGIVDGEYRSSWIVDPPDGRLPWLPEHAAARRERFARRALPADPEALSLGERCLLGFGGTAGPPMLNVLYNNYYRIVQTADHIVIVVEMVHDARIVRLDGGHGPPANKRWLGDSIGHWDGDTLVVETEYFHPARARNYPVPYSDQARVVERFTRVAEQELRYEFEVEDPGFYARPFRGEMTFRGVHDRLFEYACQEGNYAMGNILRGARREERGSVENGVDP